MKANAQLQATVFVIFGGAGDLAWRKLIPALFDLFHVENLPEQFKIIIVDREEISEVKLRKHLKEGIDKFSKSDKNTIAEKWKLFEKHIAYLQGDFKSTKTYTLISKRCDEIEKAWNAKPNLIFYMATPPALFGEIPKYLNGAGLSKDRERSRIVVEKPIGHDLESTRALNRVLTDNFDESQIFRIDHYLGKETVQNILAFRFANPLFEPIWNRRYIDYVTITVAEQIGVEHRGNYYEHAGALRDMVQNHMMQLLCLIAMEPMVSFNAEEIRNKKIDVLHAIRPIQKEFVHEYVIRGQYARGWIEGKEVCGYREEDGVPPNSLTETFAALKLYVDNWRWQDVPFYLRTGKRLARHVSEVSIHFKAVPHQAFPPEATLEWHPSRLVISIQPEQGIVLLFQAKHPGPKMHLRLVGMGFDYAETFAVPTADAYDTLLWDVMINDPTLFMRADQVEAAWQILTPVLEMWSLAPPIDFPNYEAGSWGPEAAHRLLAKEGHNWPPSMELAHYNPAKICK